MKPISEAVTLYLYSEFDYGGVAIIDVEGDDYTFEIFSSPYNYSVMNNLTADQALGEASKFLSSWKRQMRMILDDNGSIIGYEIRPLFRAVDYGGSDIFDTVYKPEGNNIIVIVDLKSEVRKMSEYDLFRSE